MSLGVLTDPSMMGLYIHSLDSAFTLGEWRTGQPYPDVPRSVLEREYTPWGAVLIWTRRDDSEPYRMDVYEAHRLVEEYVAQGDEWVRA